MLYFGIVLGFGLAVAACHYMKELQRQYGYIPPPNNTGSGHTIPPNSWTPSRSNSKNKNGRHGGGCNNTPDKCSICCEIVTLNGSAIKLRCMHKFHKQCINKWIKVEGVDVGCPNCRKPICSF